MARRKSRKSSSVPIETISDDDSDGGSGSDAENPVERESRQQQELSILNDIFKTDPKSVKYSGSLKYVFYAAALFFVLSLPFTDRVIELAFPLSTSWLILVITKTIAFFIAYYILMTTTTSGRKN